MKTRNNKEFRIRNSRSFQILESEIQEVSRFWNQKYKRFPDSGIRNTRDFQILESEI